MTNYNDGKWHGWNGGECPVHPRAIVEYCRYADDDPITCEAREVWWRVTDHDDADQVPIVFRVLNANPEPREFWVVMFDGSYEESIENAPGSFKVREVLE